MSEMRTENQSRGSWFERHPKRTLWGIFFVFLALFEWAVRVFVGFGVLPMERHRLTARSHFFHENNRDFGRWHFPGIQFKDTGPCYDAVYQTNRHGARDRERELVSALSRTVVLGDSFVEGLYVNDGQRITDHLEAIRNRPHLNFGVIGFSPIMAWVQYRTLVKKFDHDEVLVFMLPSNDFSDSDPAQRDVNGYRPYLRQNREMGAFELYYPVTYSLTQQRDLSRSKIFLNYLSTYWYTYNVVRQRVRVLKGLALEDSPREPPSLPYQFLDRTFAPHVFHAYDQLALLTEDKPTALFIIPTKPDLEAYGGVSQESPPVVTFMKGLEQRHEHLWVIDLAPGFHRYAETHKIPIEAFFLPCDWHWSPLGHRVAAELAAEQVIAMKGKMR